MPAIAANLLLVQAACATASFRELIFDPERDRHPAPPAGLPEIHILQPFGNVAGGAEWHAVNLGERLRPHSRVTLWTENRAAADVFGRRSSTRPLPPTASGCLRERIGRAARETIEAICSERSFQRFVDFYLR